MRVTHRAFVWKAVCKALSFGAAVAFNGDVFALVYLLLGNSCPSSHVTVFSVAHFGSTWKGQFHCTSTTVAEFMMREADGASFPGVSAGLQRHWLPFRGDSLATGRSFGSATEVTLRIGDRSSFLPLSTERGCTSKSTIYARASANLTYHMHFLEGSRNLFL